MGVKFNKKLEEGPWGENGRKQTEYPWVRGEADVNGGTNFTYANPEKPEDSSCVVFKHDGSFCSNEVDDEKKGLTNELSHESRNYVSGGSSNNTDGHDDKKVHSTSRVDTSGDSGRTTGGTNYEGTGEKNICGTGQGSFSNDTDGNTYKTSKGDVISEHTGSQHSSLEGDQVSAIKGNLVSVVSDGEYQLHIQGGNMDTRVEGGKLQIYSGDAMIINTAATALYRSISDMTITSDTKITLKVGGSSIVIDSGSIKMVADRIDLN
jgi:hypothetical protein